MSVALAVRHGGSRLGELEHAISAAAEAGDLVDLAARVLPGMCRAARASSALLYRYDDDGRLCPIAGDMGEVIGLYARHYLPQDPVQVLPRKLEPRPRVVLASRRCGARAYRASAAYGEFYRAFDFEHLACVWLTHRRYATPGMTGLLFARPRTAGDFDADDERLLDRALPALAAATARAERLRDLDRQRQALEALAAGGPPRLILSARGEVVWTSPVCAGLAIPDPLRFAARRLLDGDGVPTTVGLDGGRGARLSVLRPGELALVELDGAGPSGPDLARRHQLTPAEGNVLALLAEGLGNKAIAARLFVSIETVRSHVRSILGKLGVSSRTEAAVAVRRS
jgi:DNA-binding CsgD family transcriptional regulator